MYLTTSLLSGWCSCSAYIQLIWQSSFPLRLQNVNEWVCELRASFTRCSIHARVVYVRVVLRPLSGTAGSFHQTTRQKCLFTSHIYSYLSFRVNGFPKIKCLTFTLSLWLSDCGVNESEQKHLGVKTTRCLKCLRYTLVDRNCIYMSRITLMRFIQTLYFQIG